MTQVRGKGYLGGQLMGKNYSSHRICWAIHYGHWPSGQIDNINGNKKDNRIENLRIVTNSQNMKNQSIRSDNTTGHIGVYHRKEQKRWRAAIGHEGKLILLGQYKTKEEAIEARITAEKKYGFQKNHGRF